MQDFNIEHKYNSNINTMTNLNRGINVKDIGLTGNGIIDDYNILNTWISSIGSTPTDLYFPNGIYKISTSIVIPSNIRLIFANNAMLSPDNTKSITINGQIEAGIYQIFGGLGVITGTPKILNVYPEWFGVKGDGLTDDSVAFGKCLSFCSTGNYTCRLVQPIYNLNGLSINLINLKIIGTNKNVLKNVGIFTVTGDIHLDNITVQEITTDIFITLNPSAFSKVYINNVKSFNTAGFTNNTRASRFIYASNSSPSVGISNLEVTRCEFSYFSSYVIILKCYIGKAEIKNNTISEIGYITNSIVCAIILGYQDGNNVITAPAYDVEISHNTIKNLYTQYGTTHDLTECHGILVYGYYINISNNTVSNLYGGGTDSAHLESGYDHEAIYFKATKGIIENNVVTEGAGTLSDGNIVSKGSDLDYCVIRGNRIYSTYGTGVFVQGCNNQIIDNIVELVGTGINNSSCIRLVDAVSVEPNVIRGNQLYNRRTKTSNTSSCIIVETIFNTVIESNTILSTTTIGIYVSATQDNGKLIISNNNFILTDSQILKTFISGTNVNKIVFTSNNIKYTSTLLEALKLMETSNTYGSYIISNNTFNLLSYAREITNLDCASYVIDNNTIYTGSNIGTDYLRMFAIVNSATNSTALNSISNNMLSGTAKTTSFIAIYYGNNAKSGYNIGALRVTGNQVLLDNGRLIISANGERIYTNNMMVLNNYTKTSAVSPSTIVATHAPDLNYTTSGNLPD